MKNTMFKLLGLMVGLFYLSACGDPIEYDHFSPTNNIDGSDDEVAPLGEVKEQQKIFVAIPFEQCFLEQSDSSLDRLVTKNLKELLPAMVAIPTIRTESLNTPEEIKKIEELKALLDKEVKEFNKTIVNQLRPFQWQKEIDGKVFWVFGYRLGFGDKKIALFTHADVVPANNDKAFELTCENRLYMGKEQPFLVGRGALDDKGPTIATLSVLETLAKELSPQDLNNITIEMTIDTSEEVEFSSHYYFDDEHKDNRPDFGIVVDASWCTVAEKGIERPTFIFPQKKEPKDGLWIKSISVPEGNPTNVIPDFAEAVITGKNIKDIDKLKTKIEALYNSYTFDDPNYRKAEMKVSKNKKGALVLRTEVSGAQHGSAPQENREFGANPVVSLLNFIAHLVESDIIAANAYSDASVFVKDTFGTMVFGEKHPDLLERSDAIFKEKDANGTTYAITNVVGDDDVVKVLLDVRYALDHHQCGRRDNKTFGTLEGKSVFRDAFEEIVTNFKKEKSIEMSFETKTVVGPDLKNTKDEPFVKANAAFKRVMGKTCPRKAIGGATDAKGEPELITAGALFEFSFGYPTYYHGRVEGVPVNDLYKTSKILLDLLKHEIGKVTTKVPFKLWLRRKS